jgi:protein involved in plasmid replication-relaxation
MKQTDTLGRSTFHHIATLEGVKPTNREVRWFKHIEFHGPQSSELLFELTRDTHRCKDTALRQLRKLRAGGFLSLPRQQRTTEHADFNPYIYDLTQKAKTHLVDLGIAEQTVRPTGHWWHGYMTSCITSAIDIAAARDGVRYIPAHEILAINNAPLAIPINGQKLIPDQFFALDYGGGYRVFALEVDRGTEPKTSSQTRKSYAKSIAQYQTVLAQNIHRNHYGLKANILVLWVFSRRSNEARFLEMVDQSDPNVKALICTQALQNAHSYDFQSENHYRGDWTRCGHSPFRMMQRR